MSQGKRKREEIPVGLSNDPVDKRLTPWVEQSHAVGGSERIVTGTKAAQLADLSSLLSDLSRVDDYCAALIAKSNRREGDLSFDDIVVLDALFSAAITAYGKCYTEGKSEEAGQGRRTLRPFVDKLDEKDREFHKYIMKLRDKHFAHRVLDEDKAGIIAFYDDKGKLNCVQAFHLKFSRSVDMAKDLSELVGKLKVPVNALLKAEEASLAEECPSTLP